MRVLTEKTRDGGKENALVVVVLFFARYPLSPVSARVASRVKLFFVFFFKKEVRVVSHRVCLLLKERSASS